MNSAWALLGLATIGALSFLLRRLGGEKTRPIILVNFVWMGCFALIGIEAIEYDAAPSGSWLALILTLAVFNGAALIAAVTSTPSGTALENLTTDRLVHSVQPILRRDALLFLTLLYSLGFSIYLITIHNRFGLNTLLSDPESIRSAAGESYLAAVPFPARMLLYLGPILFAVYGYRRACSRPFRTWIRLLAMVAIAFSLLALLQRTNLFLGVLFLFGLLVSSPNQRHKSSSMTPRGQLLALTTILGLSLFSAFQFLANSLGKTGTHNFSSGAVKQWVIDLDLYSPIMYYTSGTMGLLHLMGSNNSSWPSNLSEAQIFGAYNPQTYGAALFSPLLRIFPITEPFPSISPFIDVGVYTNVYTWFEHSYRDFRLPGMIIFAASMGFVLTRLYANRFENVAAFWIQPWILSAAILGVLANKWTTPAFLAMLVFLWYLGAKRQRLSNSLGARKIVNRSHRTAAPPQ